MKKRPSAWWFVVGGVLLVAGIGIGVALIVTSVARATHTDGTFAADGSERLLSAPAGQERMVFVPADAAVPSCSFTDGHDRRLPLRGVFGRSTVTTGGREWVAFGTLDTSGDGAVRATCTADPAVPVRMGAPITLKGLGGSILGAFAAFFGLGGAGFLVLVVTTILFVTRRPQADVTRG